MTNPEFSKLKETTQSGFRILYICSAGRGGSTMTGMFMGGHSQVASLGEINGLGKALGVDAVCSCGEKLRVCSQWAKVFEAIRSTHGTDLIKNPYEFRLWDKLGIRVIDHRHQTLAHRSEVFFHKVWLEGRNYLPYSLRKRFPIPPALLKALYNKMDLYQTISRCWGKSVIVDLSKNFREAVELHQRWPDLVKVLLLTRDGRGVYLSCRSSGFSQSKSVNGWLNYYRRALPLLESHIAPSSLLKIRYEDLASDPEKIGRDLCDFSGISFEPQMLDLSSVTKHLVNGNNTRFSPGKGIRLDERWRTELNGIELDFFERMGSDMNRRLGYS